VFDSVLWLPDSIISPSSITIIWFASFTEEILCDIKEIGAHEKLMLNGGYYKNLYDMQYKNFIN
jgi:hypothetical protein